MDRYHCAQSAMIGRTAPHPASDPAYDAPLNLTSDPRAGSCAESPDVAGP